MYILKMTKMMGSTVTNGHIKMKKGEVCLGYDKNEADKYKLFKHADRARNLLLYGTKKGYEVKIIKI